MAAIPHPHSQQSALKTTLYVLFLPVFPRVNNMLWGNTGWDILDFAPPEGSQWGKVGKVFPNPQKWDSFSSDGLEQFSFSGQPLVKKSTVTFRVFTWEVTSLNRQVLSFSSSHCHAGDRWKKIPGTPQCSKADSKVYEPTVGKHTKTPNPALGRALRE